MCPPRREDGAYVVFTSFARVGGKERITHTETEIVIHVYVRVRVRVRESCCSRGQTVFEVSSESLSDSCIRFLSALLAVTAAAEVSRP